MIRRSDCLMTISGLLLGWFPCYVAFIGATTLWDPWDASPPTFKDVGTKIIWPPTFTSGCFCCTRLIITNDHTNVFNCSLLLNTGVGRRLVMITSGEEECQCLANWQHARAVHVKLLLPVHYVAKNELEPFLPSGPSQLSKRGCAYGRIIPHLEQSVSQETTQVASQWASQLGILGGRVGPWRTNNGIVYRCELLGYGWRLLWGLGRYVV